MRTDRLNLFLIRSDHPLSKAPPPTRVAPLLEISVINSGDKDSRARAIPWRIFWTGVSRAIRMSAVLSLGLSWKTVKTMKAFNGKGMIFDDRGHGAMEYFQGFGLSQADGKIMPQLEILFDGLIQSIAADL